MIMPCKDILYFEGESCGSNYSGISSRIFVVPMQRRLGAGGKNVNLIRKWKSENDIRHTFNSLKLPSDPEESNVKIVGAVPVEINPLKSSAQTTSQGPVRGKVYTTVLKLTLVGRSLEQIDLLTSLMLTNQIGIVYKDANGNYRLLADEDNQIDIQTDDNSGEGPTSEAASTLTCTLTSVIPPFFYHGIIAYGISFEEKDSVMELDCHTGLDNTSTGEE